MAKPKPRVVKNYEKLDEKLREAIAERYPNGYASEIQTFSIGGGKLMSALPFETDDFYYMIKFPAVENIEDDQDNLGGGNDDLDLEGAGKDFDNEEDDEPDEVEKPIDNYDDIDVADTDAEAEADEP